MTSVAEQSQFFAPPPTPDRVYVPDVVVVPPEVDELVERLGGARIGRTFNQYEADPGCADRLRRYLASRWSAGLVLVGEAAGYRGARLSGVAFTSPAQLGIGSTKEASSTIVHRALCDLGVEERVLLWNIVPTHPHLPGQPATNRPPTAGEIRSGMEFLDHVLPGRRVLAVGQVAHKALGRSSLWIRHPSHGGATLFEHGLAQVVGTGRAA